jgi:hypothetical protein
LIVSVCPPIVTVPLRAAPVFPATDRSTVPLPVPDAPFTIVIHGAFGVVVHPHVVPDAVTAIDTGPPGSPTFCEVGLIEIVHGGGAPACVTVNVRPAIVIVPLRAAVPLFAATLNCTLPLPVPELPPVMVIHETADDAVQPQLLPALTPTLPVPPSAGTDWLFDPIE